MRPPPCRVICSICSRVLRFSTSMQRRESRDGVALAIEPVAGAAEDHVILLAGHERRAVGAACLDHLHEPRHFVDVHVVDAVGIRRAAAPFHAAVEAGEHDGLIQAGRGERAEVGRRADAVECHLVRLGGDVGGVLFRVALAHERRRLRGEWLRGPGFLAAQIGRGHGLFFDGPQRLAGHAIEDKEQIRASSPARRRRSSGPRASR